MLVLRIQRTEVAGNGQGIHILFHLPDFGQYPRQVQRLFFLTVEVVAAGKVMVMRRCKPALHLERGDQFRIVPDQKQRHPPAFALGDGVGGQRGGYRYHLNRRRVFDANFPDDVVDPDGQIAPGRQAFVGSQHPAGVVIQQDTVGICSAGVDAQHQCRLLCILCAQCSPVDMCVCGLARRGGGSFGVTVSC